jgi:hypothetical protein
MNINTGETISQVEYEKLSIEEKANYINIQRKEREAIEKVKKEGRLEFERNKQFHQSKEVAKRRAANKRSHKAFMQRKRAGK